MTSAVVTAPPPTSAPASGGGERPRGRARRPWFWLVLAGALLLLAFVGGRPPSDGDPLDPRGTGPLGTRGLVLLLEFYGAEVTITDAVPGPGTEVALLLADRLDDDDATRLRQWVTDGGTLVVTDPSSPLTPLVAAPGAGGFATSPPSSVDRQACDVGEGVEGVDELEALGGLTFEVPDGARSCFGDGDTAFLVDADADAGRLVALGGAGLFVNDALDQRDNGVLAVRLLAPSPGTAVALLQPPGPGQGDGDVLARLPPRARAALWQGAVAFALYALWRGRRLGRPVTEAQAVPLAGSELVVAVGELLQQRRSPDEAARRLRAHTRRSLAGRLGLAPGAAPEALADAIAPRTPGVDRRSALDALADGPVGSDTDLVHLARQLESLRQEVLHA